jgi:hypothetical protein
MTLLVLLALAGFPVALGLAWVFDIVPDPVGRGLRLRSTVDGDASVRGEAARRRGFVFPAPFRRSVPPSCWCRPITVSHRPQIAIIVGRTRPRGRALRGQLRTPESSRRCLRVWPRAAR